MVTLYRACAASSATAKPSWMDGHPEVINSIRAGGRWFTDSLEEAEWYLQNEYFDNGQILALTLSSAQAEQYRVSNIPLKSGGKATADNPHAYSRRPEVEFYLPQEIASLATQLKSVPMSNEPKTNNILFTNVNGSGDNVMVFTRLEPEVLSKAYAAAIPPVTFDESYKVPDEDVSTHIYEANWLTEKQEARALALAGIPATPSAHASPGFAGLDSIAQHISVGSIPSRGVAPDPSNP